MARYETRFQNEQSARAYRNRFKNSSRRRIHEREVKALRQILPHFPGRSILDVPCGAGRFLPTLKEFAPDKLGAIDVSPQMVELAGEEARLAGIQAELLSSSASSLALPDGSYDLIFCNRLFHHLEAPDRAQVLKELHRVSRRYLLTSFFDYHQFSILRSLQKLVKRKKFNWSKQPTYEAFLAEADAAGWKVRNRYSLGPFTRQSFLVLEKK